MGLYAVRDHPSSPSTHAPHVAHENRGAWGARDVVEAHLPQSWSNAFIDPLFPFFLSPEWGQIEIVIRP